MIKMIYDNEKLKCYLKNEIEDAGIKVEVEPGLSTDKYVGIKVDDYYGGQKLGGETPKSVDYIVPVDCECDAYVLYILEFKNVNGPDKLNTRDIQDKFDTAVNRFLKKDFSDIFANDRFKYKDIKLYLVTTAYRNAMKYGNYEKYIEVLQKMKARDTLAMDLALSERTYLFRGHKLRIQKEIPPNPVIRRIS